MFIHLYILTIILKYGMSSYYKKGHWSYVVNAWKQNFLCRFYKRKLKKHLHSVLSTIKFRFLGLWFNVRWWDTDTRDLREENASYMNVCLNIYGCQFVLVVNYWNCSAVYSVLPQGRSEPCGSSGAECWCRPGWPSPSLCQICEKCAALPSELGPTHTHNTFINMSKVNQINTKKEMTQI